MQKTPKLLSTREILKKFKIKMEAKSINYLSYDVREELAKLRNIPNEKIHPPFPPGLTIGQWMHDNFRD